MINFHNQNAMHIAFFTNTYRPFISGVVRSISTFRRALTQLNQRIFIFAQDAGSYKDDEPFIFRYPAFDLPVIYDYPLTLPISPFIDKLLPTLKLDIIHSHHPFLLGQKAAKLAAELNLPLVFTFHTRYRDLSHYIALNQDLVKGTIDRIIGDYMQRCQHIIAPSESMRCWLAAEYGVSERVTVVPTGIDIDIYESADGQAIRQQRGWGQDQILISVGRLVKEKNWQTLLTAAHKVMRQQDGVRLVIIGEGEERKNLERYAQELEVAHRVEFVGQLPFDKVPAYLKAADLVCFSSLNETQGLVTVEAMAAGLPIVAVSAGGTADTVTQGKEGLLTVDDPQALAEAITQLLNNEALRRCFSQAAVKKAQAFAAPTLAQKLLAVYERAKVDKEAHLSVSVEKYKPVLQLVKDQWQKLPGF
jgi:glycosyltransferase involved in cell wall biosynthesis